LPAYFRYLQTHNAILQRRDLAEAVANAEGRIRALVSACLEEDPEREIDHIYFRLGDPFNAFNITGCACAQLPLLHLMQVQECQPSPRIGNTGMRLIVLSALTLVVLSYLVVSMIGKTKSSI